MQWRIKESGAQKSAWEMMWSTNGKVDAVQRSWSSNNSLERVGEKEIKVDWSEVLAGIPGVSNRDVKRLVIEGKDDILTLLELFPGVDVDYQPWGGDMPGRDGIWIDFYTRSKEGTRVLKALKLIVSRLSSLHAT